MQLNLTWQNGDQETEFALLPRLILGEKECFER